MGKQTEWTLREVASWTKDESPVSIPSLQRGLVWKPQQVELLWDSILRQFPIGTFTLADSVDGNQPYSLLDGQQRWNAISSGFGVCSSDTQTSRTILWFDLKPELVWDSSKTTRRFFIRATTKAHPWGYLADDDCSRLNTAQKRDALIELGFGDKNIFHDGICLSETYPIKSGCPLPLYWFLDAGEKAQNQNEFTQLILRRIKGNVTDKSFRLKAEDIDENTIAQYYKVFKAVSSYTVPTIYLEQSVIDQESETEKTIDDQKFTDIEVLFARIGTGGTQITQNELIYSAIKAYWPNYIKEENDRLADLYMPPYSLIMLAFRLALSKGKEELVGNLSIKKVRQIARNKDSEEYKAIESLYNLDNGRSHIDTVLEMVNSWLTENLKGELEVPTILRTSVARNSPDVYLLLMAYASRMIIQKQNNGPSEMRIFRALAFYMHWFVIKGKAKLANEIYKATLNHNIDEFPEIIKGILYGYYISGNAIPLLPSIEFSNIFGENGNVGYDQKWRTWEDGRTNLSWWPLWKVVSSEKEILLYAQRAYMCKHFPNYDPAKLDMWEEYNRPWDYDHIIPQNWIYQYKAWRKEYSDYCKNWLDKNGNMAAIPFEVNRAKSDEANWDEYIGNASALLMDQDIQKFPELFNNKITQDSNQAYLFAKKTFGRIIRIYNEVLSLVEPVNANSGEILSLHPNLEIRKSRLETIQKYVEAQNIYFECNGKEFPIVKNTDWAISWLSTGRIINGCYAAITMFAYDNMDLWDQIEIGLRRIPGQSELLDVQITPEMLSELNDITKDFSYQIVDGPWWHIQTKIPFKTKDEKIVEYLTKLIQFAEKL